MSTPPPVWSRLDRIVSYPFRGPALYALLAVTGFISLLGWLPGVGWLMQLVGWFGGYKYAFEILHRTAHGELEPPEVEMHSDNDTVWRFIALVVCSQALNILVLVFAPRAFLPVLALTALLLPAAVMLLAMTGDLLAALSPPRWIGVVAGTGWAYALLVLLAVAIQAAVLFSGALLGWLLPPMLAQPAGVLLSLWALFATFHLMGWVLWQSHERLGYDPTLHGDLPVVRDRDAELLAQVDGLLAADDVAAARALLDDTLRERAANLAVNDAYRALLRRQGDREALLAHGTVYLMRLLLERQPRRALGLARECLDLDPAFAPADAESAAQLADHAMRAGQGTLALDLLRAALRAEPKHPKAAGWALQAARWLRRHPDGAREALAVLRHAQSIATDAAELEVIAAELAELAAG